jgi:hypothetical protein
MKVYEIVNEADNVIPFPGKGPAPKNGANAFSQMANQLGGTSSTGGTTTATPTGSVHTSNPNNPNNPAKPSTTTAPASTDTTNKKQKPDVNELKKKLKPEHKSKVDKLVEKQTYQFLGSKQISWLGRKASIIVPVLSWIDEMATVNVLFDEGYIDGKQAQNYRAAYSGACFTEMITNWAAFLAFAKTSSTIITGLRTILGAIPGAGWIAWVATGLTQAAIFALLNTEYVQNYICKLIMTLAWPAADWVGSVGELGAVNWADKVKDELRDAAKEPGALGDRGGKRTQQTTPTQPASKPAAPSSGQAAQPSAPAGQSITGADLMKSIGL